jgi:hypothetical protein
MFLFCACLVLSVPASAHTPLFSSTLPLVIEFELDINALCRDRQGACAPARGLIRYAEEEGLSKPLQVRVRTRGDFRLHELGCSYPPLFLEFDAEAVRGTVFEGQSVLPLTTHCFDNRSNYRAYVLKEYLAYRIWNQFTSRSVRARLASVTWYSYGEDSGSYAGPAFFTEHFDDVARRNGLSRVEHRSPGPRDFDPVEMTSLALFQFLIGNTDWSALGPHNVTWLDSGDHLTPLPFDFDFSGLVDAEYANPSPGLKIRRVTQRLYRGFCYPELDWDPVYRSFSERRAALEGVISEIAEISQRAAKQAQNYLRNFYRIIDSEKQRRKRIEKQCRPID